MKNKIITKISTGILMLALLAVPQLSYADWSFGIGIGDRHDDRDHHFYRYHDHPRYGYRMHFLPEGYFTVWAGGMRYYYYDGLYYSYVGGDYVLVAPPAGAVVRTIPSDFQPVVINGATYYVNNGTYYLYTSHGYQVVAAPVMVVQPAPVVVAQPVTTVVTTPAPVAVEESFTVNVPNDKSGYIPVVLKRSGKGYVGPQGEFYPEFPKVAQLKVMYGK
jgi:hypothetical protein